MARSWVCFRMACILVDIDYPQERLHEIEDTTEFIREADIEKVTYVFA